jgi:hypothetical protein
MGDVIATDRVAQKLQGVARTALGLLLLALPVSAVSAQSVGASSRSQTGQAASISQQPSFATPKLPAVTVEATLKRQELRRRVNRFVSAVIVKPSGDAFDRWSVPICPLVDGLPKALGEVLLERISKAAMDAHAPLAGEKCDPNLFVVGHDHVGQVLMKWWAHRDRTFYDYNDRGIQTVEDFFRSRRPISVWYNTAWGGTDGTACTPLSSANVFSSGLPGGSALLCSGADDTHLIRSSSGSNITTAVVVIDMDQLKGMTLQQLGDYIALIGLANVRLGADPSPVRSILELFDHPTPPKGLTQWDRALLYSLYNTSGEDRLQVPELEMAMVRHIEP